jgi:hypothetical protein
MSSNNIPIRKKGKVISSHKVVFRRPYSDASRSSESVVPNALSQKPDRPGSIQYQGDGACGSILCDPR